MPYKKTKDKKDKKYKKKAPPVFITAIRSALKKIKSLPHNRILAVSYGFFITILAMGLLWVWLNDGQEKNLEKPTRESQSETAEKQASPVKILNKAELEAAQKSAGLEDILNDMAANAPQNKAIEPAKPSLQHQAVKEASLILIIDDMGLSRDAIKKAAQLPRPIHFSFLPYASASAEQAKAIKAMGHSVMLHLPMEPRGTENPGPKALTLHQSEKEFKRLLDWNLDQIEGYHVVNNHMGSLLSENKERMTWVMQALKKHGYVFLDSLTSAHSEGANMAVLLGMPRLERDIFLDNDRRRSAIRAQFEKAIEQASQTGQAVAIGHPYPETLAVLAQILPELEARGVHLRSLEQMANRE